MNSILVATTLEPTSEVVVEQAASLALACGAELRLIHVAPPKPDFVGYRAGPPSVRDQVAHEMRDEHRHLEELATQLQERGLQISFHLARGAPAEQIKAEADRIGADLIVCGTHGRGMVMEALLGSVSHELARSAGRPVMVVPPT